MTIDEAIKYWELFLEEIPMIDVSCGWDEHEQQEQTDATNLALSALRAQKEAESKPLTNGDHIRAMSEKELAEIIQCPHIITDGTVACRATPVKCIDCKLDWLRQPCEGGKGDGQID